jgi:hypothetical protein
VLAAAEESIHLAVSQLVASRSQGRPSGKPTRCCTGLLAGYQQLMPGRPRPQLTSSWCTRALALIVRQAGLHGNAKLVSRLICRLLVPGLRLMVHLLWHRLRLRLLLQPPTLRGKCLSLPDADLIVVCLWQCRIHCWEGFRHSLLLHELLFHHALLMQLRLPGKGLLLSLPISAWLRLVLCRQRRHALQAGVHELHALVVNLHTRFQ